MIWKRIRNLWYVSGLDIRPKTSEVWVNTKSVLQSILQKPQAQIIKRENDIDEFLK